VDFSNRNVELADEYHVECVLDACQLFVDMEIFYKRNRQFKTQDLLKHRVFQTCTRFQRFHGLVVYLLPFVAELSMDILAEYSERWVQDFLWFQTVI